MFPALPDPLVTADKLEPLDMLRESPVIVNSPPVAVPWTLLEMLLSWDRIISDAAIATLPPCPAS